MKIEHIEIFYWQLYCFSENCNLTLAVDFKALSLKITLKMFRVGRITYNLLSYKK